jgi:crotonobetainyl-CoA:carnitine CoA-transferase CaiB-like acyl-CoA transferase
VNARSVPENVQLESRGFFEAVKHPIAGDVRIPGFPARWDGRAEPWHTRAAPMLGEHNTEVLSDLGFSPQELDTLTRDEIVGERPIGA